MDNSLMIYNINTEMQYEKHDTDLATVITLLISFLSILAAGGSITGEATNVLPMLAATAIPGIFAWVMSYLAANAEMNEIDAQEVLFHE